MSPRATPPDTVTMHGVVSTADAALIEQMARFRQIPIERLISAALTELAAQQRARLRGAASTEARRRAAQKGTRP